jgi:hypothetical protein
LTPGSVPDRPVIEFEHGITVYPARFEGDRRRAVWYEDGERQQCESASEDKLADKLEQVNPGVTDPAVRRQYFVC